MCRHWRSDRSSNTCNCIRDSLRELEHDTQSDEAPVRFSTAPRPAVSRMPSGSLLAAGAAAQPRDVRGVCRQHLDDRALHSGPLRARGGAPAAFIFAIAAWLWFTVLFANFAEALAEGRSKAQAASLRGLKQAVPAPRKLTARVTRTARVGSRTRIRAAQGRFLPGRGSATCDPGRRRGRRRHRIGR